jgi:arylsulfatase A-like enzyme
MPKRDLEHLIARYDAGVAWTDGQFGRMIESLERLGLSGKTCVFLFSDHGEEFFEYGEKGHAHNLHDVLIHVPVIAAWPGVFAPQTHSQTPISLVDIPPTLIELAGGQAPEWMQGRSLAPVLLGREESLPNVPLFGTLFFRNRSELFELQYPFKLINDSANATWQLYNLASDAGERCDLAGQFPALANIHFERLERWWAESLDARAAATKDI